MPLLLATAATATAIVAATTSTTSVGAIVGAVAAGLAAGGASATGLCWWFFQSTPQLSKEHLASLEAQHQITNARIDVAHQTLTALGVELTAVTVESQAANAATTKLAESLHQSTDGVVVASRNLEAAGAAAEAAGQSLSTSLPTLKELAGKVHEDAVIIAELSDFLALTREQLTQAKAVIDTLKGVLAEQAVTVTRLEGVIETQQHIIIDRDKSISELTKEAERSNRHCQFFKEVAMRTSSNDGGPQVINVASL